VNAKPFTAPAENQYRMAAASSDTKLAARIVL
jgi:hypothetical protein